MADVSDVHTAPLSRPACNLTSCAELCAARQCLFAYLCNLGRQPNAIALHGMFTACHNACRSTKLCNATPGLQPVDTLHTPSRDLHTHLIELCQQRCQAPLALTLACTCTVNLRCTTRLCPFRACCRTCSWTFTHAAAVDGVVRQVHARSRQVACLRRRVSAAPSGCRSKSSQTTKLRIWQLS